MEHLTCNNHLKVPGNWYLIWNFHISPKVKHFIWCIQRNCLPTRQKLQKKGVNCPITCRYYHNDLGKEYHILFGCNQVKEFWEATRFWSRISGFVARAKSAIVLIFDLLNEFQDFSLKKFAIMLWCIWRRRNEKLWEDVDTNLNTSVSLSMQFLNEWLHARQHTTTSVTQ